MENCFICNKNIINDVIYIPRDDGRFWRGHIYI